MNNKICVSKNNFYLILIIFSIFIYLHFNKNSNEETKTMETKEIVRNESVNKESVNNERSKLIEDKYNELLNKIESNIEKQDKLSETLDSSTESDVEKEIVTKREVLLDRDRRMVDDDFVAPERRLPSHAYPDRNIKQMINIPTRGYPDNYQNIGILVRKEDEKILKLFGRQTYPGSNQYEYYVIDSSSNSDNKIPLEIPGNKEIYDNDVVPIPWLDQSKGLFEVKIYDYDVPRYNPYVF
jgi:hypothetical protein